MRSQDIPLLRRPSCRGDFFFRPQGRKFLFRVLLPPIIHALLALSQAGAAESVWDYKTAGRMPDPWNGVEIAVSPGMKTPDGQAVLELNAVYGSEDLSWPSHLNFWSDMTRYRDPRSVDATFWVRGESGTELRVRIVNEGHANLSIVEPVTMNGEWQKVEFHEELRQPVGTRWVCLPRIMLWKVAAGQKFWLGPVTVRVVEGGTK